MISLLAPRWIFWTRRRPTEETADPSPRKEEFMKLEANQSAVTSLKTVNIKVYFSYWWFPGRIVSSLLGLTLMFDPELHQSIINDLITTAWVCNKSAESCFVTFSSYVCADWSFLLRVLLWPTICFYNGPQLMSQTVTQTVNLLTDGSGVKRSEPADRLELRLCVYSHSDTPAALASITWSFYTTNV